MAAEIELFLASAYFDQIVSVDRLSDVLNVPAQIIDASDYKCDSEQIIV